MIADDEKVQKDRGWKIEDRRWIEKGIIFDPLSSIFYPPSSTLHPNADPLPPLGGFLHRVQDLLDLNTFAKIGGNRLICFQGAEEVGESIGERVFIADDVSGRPPRAHVGVAGFRHQDSLEPLLGGSFVLAVEMQLIERLEVEPQSAAAPV